MVPRGSVTLAALKTLVLTRLSPGAVFMILHALCPHEEGYGPSLTKVTIEACQINFVCSTPHFESLSLIDIPDGQDLRWILNHCDVIAAIPLRYAQALHQGLCQFLSSRPEKDVRQLQGTRCNRTTARPVGS
ncbi:hypothetical protein BDN67DRAFT_974520 [Paxillus ammoniavirescens]|nr:hypothetical protein BDN67DRAFT_974520 [Paxillus ammoniavirescens]